MAVRINAAGDYLSRTSTLPTITNFTMSGRARIVVDQGAGTYQPLIVGISGGSTEALGIYWDSATSAGNMRIFTAVGGVESSGANFASRPAINRDFDWYIRCNGTGTNGFTGGWKYPEMADFITVSITMSSSVTGIADWRLGNVIGTYYCNAIFGNYKCWDRYLSSEELRDDAGKRYLDPANRHYINWWWPLDNAGDLHDKSNKGRNATRGGTLDTEYFSTKYITRDLNSPLVVYAPSADVTVALSGSAVTTSAGTLGVGNSVAISGAAATASAGTLTPAIEKALAGDVSTSAAGTLGVSASVALAGHAVTASAGTLAPSTSAPLAGSEVVTSAGTVTPNVGGDVTVALTGASVSVSAGALGVDLAASLVGSAATVSAGSVNPSVSTSLSGAEVSALAGTISFSGDVTIALTGASVTVSAGNLGVINTGQTAESSGGWPEVKRYRQKISEQLDVDLTEPVTSQEVEQKLLRAKENLLKRKALRAAEAKDRAVTEELRAIYAQIDGMNSAIQSALLTQQEIADDERALILILELAS